MSEKYKAGDYVVYDIYGICRISRIEKLAFIKGSSKRDYYVLSPLNSESSTYYIPISEESIAHKLRLPMTEDEIRQLLTDAKNTVIPWTEKRQERNDLHSRILSSGITAELVSLIGCLYNKKQQLLSEGKKLSSTDENTFAQAEKMIKEEFAFSLDIPADKVSEYIHSFMKNQK